MWTFICKHTILQSYIWIMTHGYTGLWTHSYRDLISLGRMDIANCVHQVAYMSQSIHGIIIIKAPTLDSHLKISSSHGKHANHYTNRDRV